MMIRDHASKKPARRNGKRRSGIRYHFERLKFKVAIGILLER
uniref:Uncharacterized protein n=1 Tax=Arundo donax TaxID=35708 RepID=A0A0A9D8L8_ARUDO